MADWDTTFKDDTSSSSLHSRRSSQSSELSSGNKENHDLVDTEKDLILRDGTQLAEESRTESMYENSSVLKNGFTDLAEIPPRSKQSNGNPGTAKARAAKSPFAPSTIDSIPEEEVAIPADGNLSTFTADQMANFFRCLKIDDRIISHLHRKNVDGKRFGKLKDSELEAVGMKTHPVVLFFKGRSSVKTKKSNGWIL